MTAATTSSSVPSSSTARAAPRRAYLSVSEARREPLTGVERRLGVDELIVSKTDVQGRITYANRTFMRIADFTEAELLGAPHSIVRHPAMPRAVFKLLWDTIEDGREIFAYVVNRTKYGDHYWVFAHVTPTFDAAGRCVGYHSNRRAPARAAIARVEPIYAQILAEEARHEHPADALRAGTELLGTLLGQLGIPYEELVFALAAEGDA